MSGATNTFRDLTLRHDLRGGRGTCPCCGYRGALSVNERAGRVLAWCANGCNQGRLWRALTGRGPAALPVQPTPSKAAETARRQARALALWNGSKPAAGTAAALYLRSRGLPPDLAATAALRFRPDCPHPGGGRLPAMMALVTDANGQPTGVHRTFLRRDGAGKADVVPQKATLGRFWAGAIRLAPQAPELAIGEGIESSAAAGALLGLPAWAAVAAANLATGLVLPPEVQSVVIAVDRDAPGERAAQAAWYRWTAEGRRVRFLMPEAVGADACDVLRAREAAHG